MRRHSTGWKQTLANLTGQLTQRPSRKRRHRTGNWSPRFEGLEPRMMLSCDGSVSLNVTTLNVTEAPSGGFSATAALTITLSDADCGEESATVVYGTTNGTASSGTDFTLTMGTATFSAGSLTHQVNIPITHDLIDEPNETFTLTLSSPVGTTLATGSSVTTVTITDDDSAPEIRFGDPVSATEGATATSAVIQIPISLYDATGTASVVAGQSVTVSYTIATATASTPADFSGTLNGTLTFNPGVGTANIPVTIMGDDIVELNETFLITLSNPTNATLPASSDSTSLVTIVDDDGTNPISASGGKIGDAQNLQSFCEECAEASLYYSTVDMYYGSYEIDTSYMFYSEYSSSYVDIDYFSLPIYESSSMGLVTLDVIYTLPDTTYTPVPSQYSLDVTLNDAYGSPITTLPAVYYTTSGAGLGTGDEIILSVQLDPSSAPATGYYTYDATVTAHYASGISTSQSSGSVIIVNRSASAYGAGWMIDGLDQVIEYDSLGLALVRSDGSTAWFPYESVDGDITTYTASVPGYFVSAESDSSTDVVTLVTKFNEVFEFDMTNGGRLEYSYDPVGNKTTFSYSAGLIDYIEDPFLRQTEFDYDGSSKLDTITDFTGRVVDVDVSSGKLVQMTFPDPDSGDSGEPAPEFDYTYYSAPSTRYDGMLRYVDIDVQNDPDSGSTQRRMELLYSAIGQVHEVLNPDYSETNLSRWTIASADYQKLGYLVVGSGNGLSAGNPAAIVPLSTLHATHSDELGAGTHYYFDGAGLTKQISRSGPNQASIDTTIHRNANGLIDYIAEQDPDGGGPLSTLYTNFTYDGRGNLLTVTHPDSSVLTWEYDDYGPSSASQFGVPTKFTDEEGRETLYDVNSTTGVIDKITRVVGDLDGGGEYDDIVTAYTYSNGTTPTATFPKGMVLTVTEDLTDSTTVRTDFAYFTSTSPGDLYKYGRIDTITRDAANGTPSERIVESFEYDSTYGFLVAYEDGLDQRTEFTNDHLGRITKITQPYPDVASYTEIDEAYGSPRFTTSGSWSSPQAGGYDLYHINIGSGTGAYAEWNFDELVPGTTYEVFATWVDQTSGATAARFWTTGETLDFDTTVDQDDDPVEDDPFEDATAWQSLGTVVVTGDSFTVRLDQNASGTVAADAVRIVEAQPVTTMSYNAIGDLLTVTDPLGNVTKYVYDLMSRPVQVTQPDPDGGSPTYPVSTFTYDLAGNIRTMTDPVGAVTEYQYDTLQRLIKVLAPYPATEDGQIVDDQPSTGNGFTVSGGWSTGSASGYGSDSLYASNGDGSHTADWTFTGLDADQPYEILVTWVADETNNSTAAPYVVYDGTTAGTELATVEVDQQAEPPDVTVLGGKWLSLGTYTPSGTQLTVRLSDAGTGSDRVVADAVRIEPRSVTTYTYDTASNVDTITDPLGNVTDYDYDNRHRLITITEPQVGGTSPVTQVGYYKDSQIRFVADPLDRTTRYEYHEDLGWLTQVISPHPDLSSPAMKEVDDVDPEGSGFDIVAGSWTSTSGGYGDDHEYILGGGESVSAKWSFSGLTAESEYEVFATWKVYGDNDASAAFGVSYGSVDGVSVNQKVEPTDGNLFSDSPAANWQSLGVFELGVDQTTIDVTLSGDDSGYVRVVADGIRVVQKAPTQTYTYDQAGNVDTITDPLGHVTDYDYDNFNRLILRTDPDPGTAADPPETAYTYDHAHNLKTLTDPAYNTTSFSYDALNRLVEEKITLTGPVDLTRTYAYDAVGNVLRYTDRNGRQSDFVFDALYRLTTENWLDDEGAVDHTISYAYDLASRLTSADDNDVDSHLDYVYNALGQATQVDSDNFNHTYSLVSAFDLNARRTSLAATINTTKDFENLYSYDALNRLTRLDQQEQASGSYNAVAEKRVDFTYTLASQFETITRFKDTDGDTDDDVAKSTFAYDRMGRLTDLLHEELNGTASNIVDYDWTFDPASRIKQFVSSVDGTFDYAYDNTNQLIEEDDGTTETDYEYDENGNRVMTDYATGDFNRIEESPTHRFRYDNEGNQVARMNKEDGVREAMAWDHRNRLTSITTQVPREVAHWRFDGDALDSTANNLDGTLVDDAAFVGTGAPIEWNNGSLQLDGDGDLVSMASTPGDEDLLKLRTHDLSLSMWFYSDTAEVSKLVGQGNPQNALGIGYDLIYWGNTTPPKIDFRINDGVDDRQILSYSSSNLALDAWHHVVVTVDRDGDMVLYTDGVERDSEAFAQNEATDDDIIGTAAFVGGAYGSGSQSLEGYIDELRVWHQVLDDDDVAALYGSADPLYESNTAAYVDTTKAVSYDYDPFDRRIRKQIDANGDTIVDETHEYVYDGQDIVLALDESQNLENRYLHGPAVDMILADEQISTQGQAGTTYWPLTDHLGTVRDLVDNDGAVVNHIEYDAFGNIIAESDDEVEHIYGFTGRERDEESHLQFNRARYYDAAIGRWASEDPIGFVARDEHLSRYVHNQPTSRTDPLGLSDYSDAISDINAQIDQLQEAVDKLPLKDAVGLQRKLDDLRTFVNNFHEAGINLLIDGVLEDIREQLERDFGISVDIKIRDGSICVDGTYEDKENGIRIVVKGDKDSIEGRIEVEIPNLPDSIGPFKPRLDIGGKYDPHADNGHFEGSIGGSIQVPDWVPWLPGIPRPRVRGAYEIGPNGSGVTGGVEF